MPHYNANNERVLVFPTNILLSIGYFEGLCYDVDKYLPLILENNIYMKREKIESDSNFKQLIPYVIICYKDLIIRYRRGVLLNEKRLEGKNSIGIGGHISITDASEMKNNYIMGMAREINEELVIKTTYKTYLKALLNDDSNNVGKVHFGLIYVMRLDEPKVRKRELSINDLKFINKIELKSNISEYENWSRICIKDIDRLISSKVKGKKSIYNKNNCEYTAESK